MHLCGCGGEGRAAQLVILLSCSVHDLEVVILLSLKTTRPQGVEVTADRRETPSRFGQTGTLSGRRESWARRGSNDHPNASNGCIPTTGLYDFRVASSASEWRHARLSRGIQ